MTPEEEEATVRARAAELDKCANAIFVATFHSLMEIDPSAKLVYAAYHDLKDKLPAVGDAAAMPKATDADKTTAIVCVAALAFLDRVLSFNEMSKEVSGS